MTSCGGVLCASAGKRVTACQKPSWPGLAALPMPAPIPKHTFLLWICKSPNTVFQQDTVRVCPWSRNGSRKPISRILFPAPVARTRSDGHSSSGDGCPPPLATYPGASDGPPSNAPLFGLAPGGVCLASPVARGAGALLPHHFTLTGPYPAARPGTARRYAFCCTCRHALRRASALRSTLPCGVRTFLRRTLTVRRRPSGLP